ncbi:MAG: CaiB/BaiF CoA transferase family protein [Alphaproteobacteria bacterium]
MSAQRLPFEGFKVLDMTQGVAGPHSTMLLAQQGAEVTKVEPLDGDWGRTLGKMYGDTCAHAIIFNRGKRSVSLNMKEKKAQELVQKAAAEADVIVESFRPGVMGRFGLSYDHVKKINPNVVYLSVTGFGQQGPYNKLPVTDSVIQAFSGWMSINRDEEGTPQRIGMIAVDVMTGLYAFQAISAALMRKVRFGEGSYIDCSLMQSAAAFQAAKVMEHYLEGGQPQVLYVPVGTMKTSNGYINVTAMREHHYVGLCKVLDKEEWATDPRFDSREKRIDQEKVLMPMVRAEFLKKTTEEWAAALTEAGVMNAPVSTYDDFMEDEHVKEVNSISWIAHQGMEGDLPMCNIPGFRKIEGGDDLDEAPSIGQHTDEILSKWGLNENDISDLVASGIAGRGVQ